MSNAVYPVLPGLTYGVVKSPTWSTRVQTAVSGKELRAAFWSTPIWRYTLVYEFLRSASTFAELQNLVGFFNQRQGKFDSFLLDDPDDDSVTAQQFGTGDGSTTVFQLNRSYGGFTEPIYNVNNPSAVSIYVNGVLQTSGLGLTTGGVLTFTTAPAAAAVLTWTGAYYWRVRFDLDAIDFSKFMNQLWEAKQVSLITVRG